MKRAGVVCLAALFVFAGILTGTRRLWNWLQPTARAATFAVTNTGDNGGVNPAPGAGTGTLRQAIVDANAGGGTNIIVFNIPGTGVQTINIFNSSQPLPAITSPVAIDGWSQGGLGYTGPPLIELRGPGGTFVVNGLNITAGSSTVRGLVINRFNPCIRLDTNGGNIIAGNYIGTDASGTLDLGSTIQGIVIVNVPNNTIGGTAGSARNIISGNNTAGIEILGASSTGNQVLGNFIGTDVTGTIDLGNGTGIFITFSAGNNTIGGTAPGARNLISGNDTNGIDIGGTTDNQVLGNFIGTDASGGAPLGNGSTGVRIASATNTTIGGTAAGARNVISGNGGEGVGIFGSGSATLVQGNFIGTDASGNADLGNASHGVLLENGSGFPTPHTIGGTTAAARNIISGNNGSGVFISSSGNNIVQGNFIGTDVSGTLNLANSSNGINILNSASSNIIGGGAAGAGNLVALNAIDGVRVEGGSGNSIRGNAIHSNAQLGINLISAGDPANGVTPNDSCDGDSGPNNLQNFPLVTSITTSGSDLIINGTLNSTASSSFTLDFYANLSCDTTGNGEGRTHIGSAVVNTDASCNANFGVTLPNPGASVITGTATNSAGNTSEFSPCAGVPSVTFIVTNTGDNGGINPAPGAGTGTLRQAIINANANPGLDTITFNIPGMGVQSIALLSVLPDLTNPVIIDGTTQPGFAGSPLIELDGTNAGVGFTDGLRIATVNTTIKGLAINRFAASGIAIFNDENRIEGNYIGTDAGGTLDRGNGGGVFIASGANNNTLGGTTAAARNVISGNTFTGIAIDGPANLVQGNYIGTDASGTLDLGNGSVGVLMHFGASNNAIGGTTAAARNVISGNDFSGIGIEHLGTAGNLVQGNYIGTDAAGTADLGNSVIGVHILSQASQNTIGGIAPGARNVISGNNSVGITLEGAGTMGNIVQGNYIGTDASGALNLGNSARGVNIVSSASSNTIGGTAAGAGNLIAFNGFTGVRAETGNSNGIRGNSIHSNGQLGIDLVAAGDPASGVTPNDNCDGDAGANNLQNFPVLTSASSSGGSTTIQGTLDSVASSIFNIDFYSSPSCDGSGNGEGKTYLGSAPVTTGNNCTATINVTLPVTVFSGFQVTATATNNAGGNTSEFSACITASGPTAIALVSFNASAYDDRVLLEWRTGFEVNNLGFNIYRRESGKDTLINAELIAGSTLLVGAETALRAGRSYAWWDSQAHKKGTLYLLEELDLSGQSTWYGPVSPQMVSGPSPERINAPTLSGLGTAENRSMPVESRAELPGVESINPQLPDGFGTQLYPFNLAAEPAVKIYVKREGWYRVTQAELLAAGLNPNVDPRFLQLFVDGREIPMHVSTGKLGAFDGSGAIEFYGIGLDTPATDTRVYWLAAGVTEGKRITQTKSDGAPSTVQSFSQTVERKDKAIYFSALRNGDKENFFGAVVAGGGTDQTLNVTHLAQSDTSNFETRLEVGLQGVTARSHRVLVQLNDVAVREISFSGQQNSVTRFNIDHTLLRDGENIVGLIPQDGAGDISLVDHIRLTYQRTFDAVNDVLKFSAYGGQLVTIGGFSSKSIRVFDITDPDNVQELIGAVGKSKTGFSINVSPQQHGLRTLLAITNEMAKNPAALKANEPSSWSSRANAADFVVITTSNLSEAIEPLKPARRAEGYRIAVVGVEDIYDEFGYGHKSPQAVRDFLTYAALKWQLTPRFLLLVGDASYDPRGYLGTGAADLVPTKLIDTEFMETASDDWFSDFDGDGVADLATGRLPVRNIDEASLVVKKLISYVPVAGEALLVADENDGFNFEAAASYLRSLIPDSIKVTQVNRGRVDAETAKKAVMDAIHRKLLIVNYLGHGSVNQWRADLLRSSDAATLRNAQLPLFVMMTCLNGYFHDATVDSLAESLIKAEDGGAIAVWASSGMTFPDQQAALNRELYRLLFSSADGSIKSGATLGEAARSAKLTVSDADVRRTWILLGDPSMRLR